MGPHCGLLQEQRWATEPNWGSVVSEERHHSTPHLFFFIVHLYFLIFNINHFKTKVLKCLRGLSTPLITWQKLWILFRKNVCKSEFCWSWGKDIPRLNRTSQSPTIFFFSPLASLSYMDSWARDHIRTTCDLCHRWGNIGSFNPLCSAGDQTYVLPLQRHC